VGVNVFLRCGLFRCKRGSQVSCIKTLSNTWIVCCEITKKGPFILSNLCHNHFLWEEKAKKIIINFWH